MCISIVLKENSIHVFLINGEEESRSSITKKCCIYTVNSVEQKLTAAVVDSIQHWNAHSMQRMLTATTTKQSSRETSIHNT